jgi:ATP-dependent helicase/DNAse subunit B
MSELKGERIPAGVFYFPASINYTTDDEGRFRMRGFMNGAEDALRSGDKNLSPEHETIKSEYFPAALKNSAVAKRVMDEETFRNFLDYAVLVARQGCKELKDGYIAPSPYKGSCDYCKYGGMCGFNKDTSSPRKESAIEPNTIANIAKESREGK